MEFDDNWICTTEAARLHSCGVDRIRQLIANGTILGKKVGPKKTRGVWLVYKPDVLEHARSAQVGRPWSRSTTKASTVEFDDNWIDTDEAARLHNCSQARIKQLIKDNTIRSKKVGTKKRGIWLVYKPDVVEHARTAEPGRPWE